MAKKPKGFGASLQHKQKTKEHQRFIKRFQQQVNQGHLKDVKLIDNPVGETKMSEVLEAFVDPYLDFTSDRGQVMMLLTIAVAAWNIALLPQDRHPQEIETILKEVFRLEDRRSEEDFRDLLTGLVTRKLELFADNHRMIMDFQLQTLSRDELHLSVASTLPVPELSEASPSDNSAIEAAVSAPPAIES